MSFRNYEQFVFTIIYMTEIVPVFEILRSARQRPESKYRRNAGVDNMTNNILDWKYMHFDRVPLLPLPQDNYDDESWLVLTGV